MSIRDIPHHVQTRAMHYDGGNGSNQYRYDGLAFNQKTLRRWKRRDKQVGVQARRSAGKRELRQIVHEVEES